MRASYLLTSLPGKQAGACPGFIIVGLYSIIPISNFQLSLIPMFARVLPSDLSAWQTGRRVPWLHIAGFYSIIPISNFQLSLIPMFARVLPSDLSAWQTGRRVPWPHIAGLYSIIPISNIQS